MIRTLTLIAATTYVGKKIYDHLMEAQALSREAPAAPVAAPVKPVMAPSIPTRLQNGATTHFH